MNFISSLNQNVILITGNSDYSITDDIAELAPSNVKYWYAQNAECKDVLGIPMGIENTMPCKLEGHGKVWDHAAPKEKALMQKYDNQPSNFIYSNFALDTNLSVRLEVNYICGELSYITTNTRPQHQDSNSCSYVDYVCDILDHKMCVCPEGNGIDCHRVWEVLLLGRVPIVRKNSVSFQFKELPVVYVDDWNELKNRQLLEERFNQVKNNKREALSFDFWKREIISKIKSL